MYLADRLTGTRDTAAVLLVVSTFSIKKVAIRRISSGGGGGG